MDHLTDLAKLRDFVSAYITAQYLLTLFLRNEASTNIVITLQYVRAKKRKWYEAVEPMGLTIFDAWLQPDVSLCPLHVMT